MRQCRIEECTNRSRCQGMCDKHYTRLRRHGDPLVALVVHGEDERRFWAKVEKGEGCWLWTAALDTAGYGRFAVSRKVTGRFRLVAAHRYAYEHVVGPIPEGLSLDHLCRVHNCVNPAHLEPVTHAENCRRGTSLAAQNARKTHCQNGHEFNEANTYRSTTGRACRRCAADYQQRRRDALRAAGLPPR